MLAAAAVVLPLTFMGHIDLPSSVLRIFGAACPLCGGTRAVTSVFLGRFELAVRYNPLALAIFVLMVYAAASYLLLVLPFGRRVALFTTPRESFLLKGLIVAAFLANWAYVLYAGMYRVPLQA
jgi:hypothetical protein